MSATWMLQALLTGALLSAGALMADRVAGWFGRPRRGIWAAAMAGSVLLPALALWAPGVVPGFGVLQTVLDRVRGIEPVVLEGLVAVIEADPGSVAGSSFNAASGFSMILGAGWVALSLVMLFAIAWTYARLLSVRRRCAAADIEGTTVLVSESAGPAVLGLVRPAVVIPRWVLHSPAEERDLIVRHEREHIIGGDTWLLALSALAVAAMPWNLPLWWQHWRLRLAVETDCDARVLAHGANRRAYGQILIRTASRGPFLSWVAPAWGKPASHLQRRILAMTAKRPMYYRLFSTLLVGFIVASVAAACDVARHGQDTGFPTEPSLIITTAQPETTVLPRTVEGQALELEQPEVLELEKRQEATPAARQVMGLNAVLRNNVPANGAKPLIFVDGVRSESLDNIDPAAIDMIEVIKGGAAVKLYGAEAQDGVIRITMKAGRGGSGQGSSSPLQRTGR